jgi:aminopeptidase N
VAQRGLASFAEALWVEQPAGAEAYEQRARDTYRMLRQRKVGSPFDPGVERVFSSRVYVRGAFVLYGLRREIGPEKFHELQTTWVARHRDANASTADFVAAGERGRGRDLGPFFDAWLYSDVTPEIAEFGPVEDCRRATLRASGHERANRGERGERGEGRKEEGDRPPELALPRLSGHGLWRVGVEVDRWSWSIGKGSPFPRLPGSEIEVPASLPGGRSSAA